MIFKAEINPRDYDGFAAMMYYLQEKCLQECGARFNTMKIALGQIAHNSEIFWFEGYVNDDDVYQAKKKKDVDRQIEEAVKFLLVNGYKIVKDEGEFGHRTVNVHIASLGEFHIVQNTDQHLGQLKHKLSEVLLAAINDFQITANGR